MPVDEEAMSTALDELENSENTSFRGVAARHGLFYLTLRGRANGAQPHTTAHQGSQKLLPADEDNLVQWILARERSGLAPEIEQVREMALQIFKYRNPGKPDLKLGVNWHRRFFKRHLVITTFKKTKLDRSRYQGLTFEAIGPYFDDLEKIIEKRSILPGNTYNLDERGSHLGDTANGIVLGKNVPGKKRVRVEQSSGTQWVSMLETISALGRKLPTMMIFQGKKPLDAWFPEHGATSRSALEAAGHQFVASENGWTSNDLAIHWLLKIFLPSTQPEDDAWRLLICDGHGSHTTATFMYHCWENKVHLLYLPAHTSSETQPLDVCVYGPLKDRFQREISKLGIRSSSSPVQKRACIDTYFKAREIAMSSSNIESAFAATGIYPLDRSKVMNSNKLVHQRDLESQNTVTEMSFSSMVVDDLGSLSPRTRRHLINVEAAATGEAIIQRAHNQQLQKQVDLLSTSKRKARDKLDPNKVFKKRKEVKKQHWLDVQKKSSEALTQSSQELAKIYKKERKKDLKKRATQGNTSN